MESGDGSGDGTGDGAPCAGAREEAAGSEPLTQSVDINLNLYDGLSQGYSIPPRALEQGRVWVKALGERNMTLTMSRAEDFLHDLESYAEQYGEDMVIRQIRDDLQTPNHNRISWEFLGRRKKPENEPAREPPETPSEEPEEEKGHPFGSPEWDPPDIDWSKIPL